ncbi:MAG: CDP-alcohol phosphatidyltransferase family protein [Anaerolineae bacterium]|nr:CDP-alcohol phosphatidyltransferase family protein [Anaerolineae bacterium]
MADGTSRKYDTLTDWVRAKGAVLSYPIGRWLQRRGIRPNTITIAGFLFNIISGVVIATGRFPLGAVCVAIASSVDGLDGALARVSGKETRFGAFLDSTLDRLSEAALFLGLLVWLLPQDRYTDSFLVFLTMLGSIMVSYTRARAEGLGYTCKVGLLTRLERVAILCVGLLLGWVRVMLVVMTVLSWVTVLQRVFAVYHLSQGKDGD